MSSGASSLNGGRRGRAAPPRRHGQPAAAAVTALLIGVLAGCGSGETVASAEVPPDCLESWNAEGGSKSFGRHVYEEHAARQGRMSMLAPKGPSISIDGPETCAMIFSVPESDEEYGDVGLVETKFGWASMTELAGGDKLHLDQVQREATEGPNIAVFPDGTIEPG